METPVFTIPLLYDELMVALLSFLSIFVGVRVIIRLWDLVGV